MKHDQYIKTSKGTLLASYGPRKDTGTSIEEVEPSSAEFWGVYRHGRSGRAECVGDAADEDSARTFAMMVADVERIRRYNSGMNDMEKSPTGEDYNTLLDIVGV